MTEDERQAGAELAELLVQSGFNNNNVASFIQILAQPGTRLAYSTDERIAAGNATLAFALARAFGRGAYSCNERRELERI